MSNRYTATQKVVLEYIRDNGISSLDNFLIWIKNKIDTIPQKQPTEKPLENVEKKKHLNFLYLTEVEYNTLVDTYGSNNINRLLYELDTYIGSTGKEYKSHYYTIISWAKRKGLKKIEHKEIIKEDIIKVSQEAIDKFKEKSKEVLSKLHIR